MSWLNPAYSPLSAQSPISHDLNIITYFIYTKLNITICIISVFLCKLLDIRSVPIFWKMKFCRCSCSFSLLVNMNWRSAFLNPHPGLNIQANGLSIVSKFDRCMGSRKVWCRLFCHGRNSNDKVTWLTNVWNFAICKVSFPVSFSKYLIVHMRYRCAPHQVEC